MIAHHKLIIISRSNTYAFVWNVYNVKRNLKTRRESSLLFYFFFFLRLINIQFMQGYFSLSIHRSRAFEARGRIGLAWREFAVFFTTSSTIIELSRFTADSCIFHVDTEHVRSAYRCLLLRNIWIPIICDRCEITYRWKIEKSKNFMEIRK